MTARSPRSVLILGAGLAGLTAAYDLGKAGYRVTVLDHPSWHDGFSADQTDAVPVLVGAYKETWRLLRSVAPPAPTRDDVEIPYEFRLPDGRIVAYRPSRLPGALQWPVSLLRFGGLSWKDRWGLLSFLEQLWEQAQVLPSDLESRLADEWLASIGQSRTARDHVWNPLARWLTGNALSRLSAAVFVHVLSTVFLGRTSDAGLTCLQGTLTNRLVTPLRDTLQQLGVSIQLQADLPYLRIEPNRVSGIQLRDGTLLHADWYIAALPHQKLLSLLPERLLSRFAYFAQIADLTMEPHITVQFTRRSMQAGPRLILFSDQPFHQLTINTPAPQEVRYRLSAVGHSSLADLTDTQLIAVGKQILGSRNLSIETDAMYSVEVFRESNAALSLQPGSAVLRPIQTSPIKNFFIVGAWTDTGWPANLESEIVSARRCVEAIMKSSG